MKLVRSLGWLYLVGDLWGHKAFEVGLQRRDRDGRKGLDLSFRYTSRGDHAGLLFNVSLFGRTFELNVYDRRHWNWLEDRWMRPGESLPPIPPADELDLTWMQPDVHRRDELLPG